ncbi:MAG: hypothetical protein AAF514_13275 [Verrucomicrobiota bacterium]
MTDLQSTLAILENQTGVVVPVFFSKGADLATSTGLLRDTVFGLCRELRDPARICLSVDGSPSAADACQALAKEFGVLAEIAPTNRGKLAAARNGASRLLQAVPDCQYLAVLDSDGDHFPNELLNHLRCGEKVKAEQTTDKVLVLGNRRSRHRPMGFLRGELEEMADRMLLDALIYHSTIKGKPLELQFTNTLDEYPDFHSGYKVFSRACAQDVFLSPPELAGCEEVTFYRHAVEAVMAVEALVRGATLATVNRRTFDEQAVSEFGRLDRSALTADMIIWPCRRLGVPGHFVRQWLRNHEHRIVLSTLVPDGRKELGTVRKFVLEAFEQDKESASLTKNLFV